MNKVHMTLSLDAEIVEAHKSAGTNVSQLCNAFLAGYFQKEGQTFIEKVESEKKATIAVITTAQETAEKATLLEKLLDRARKLRTSGKGLKEVLDEAEKESGLPRGEIVRRL